MEKNPKIQECIDANLLLLEELMVFDFTTIDKADKDFLFSQLKKSVGFIVSIIKKNDN